MVLFDKFFTIFVVPKKIICLPVLIVFLLLGCVPQQKVSEPPQPIPSQKKSCTWEDKIWFKNDKKLLFEGDMQIKECKTIPLVFESSGEFEVINQKESQTSFYLNQQWNNEPGSTKYSNKVEKHISESMTDSEWYLHIDSEFDKPVTISVELIFSAARKASSQQIDQCRQSQSQLNQAKGVLVNGRMKELKEAFELCNTIKRDCPRLKVEAEDLENKISDKIININHDIFAQVESSVRSKNCAKAHNLLKNMDISSYLYKKSKELVDSCIESTVEKETKPIKTPKKIPPAPTPPDPCIQLKTILSKCKAAFEDEKYDQAFDLCNKIDYRCPEAKKEGGEYAKKAKIFIDQRKVFNKVISLSASKYCPEAREYLPNLKTDLTLYRQAEQKIDTCEREFFAKIISETDNGNCRKAREYLPKLAANSNLHSQAEQMIEICENPCRFLGELTIRTQGSVRKGEGVPGAGELEQNQEVCYQVKILKRGDLAVWINMGYILRGGQLEFSRSEHVINDRGDKENKMRYSWLNIAPNTVVEIWLQNRNGDQSYSIEFYLYPN